MKRGSYKLSTEWKQKLLFIIMFIYWRRKCRNDSFLCSFEILIWWYHDIGTIHISNNNNNKHKAYPLNTTFTFPFSKLSLISATCKVTLLRIYCLQRWWLCEKRERCIFVHTYHREKNGRKEKFLSNVCEKWNRWGCAAGFVIHPPTHQFARTLHIFCFLLLSELINSQDQNAQCENFVGK